MRKFFTFRYFEPIMSAYPVPIHVELNYVDGNLGELAIFVESFSVPQLVF